MSNTSGQSTAIAMIVKLTEQYFSRIHQGKMTYPKDAETLRQYALQCLKMYEPITAGSVLLTEGLAHIYAGKLDEALRVFRNAYDLFESKYDFIHIAAATNNVANIYEIRGDFDMALGCYRKALEMVKLMPENYSTDASILTRGVLLQVLKTNEGLLLLESGAYEKAKASFEAALANLDGQHQSNLEAMMEIRRGLAEIHLERGDFEAAVSSIALADELAADVTSHISQATLYYTHAHLAAKIPNYGHTPEAYHQRVERLMENIETPIIFGRALMIEARYQHLHGNGNETRHFAEKAHRIFERLGAEEERQLAAALLDSADQV